MGTTAAATEITLGQRLREYRKSRKMTLADLSQITGMNASTLSKIENGKISLNFSTVQKIAEDLSLPIANLIGPIEQPPPGGRRAITRANQGHVVRHPRWDLETLCDDLIQKRNVFWKMVLKCRSLEEYGEFSTHLGEEFLYVISGVMDLYTDVYKPVRLEVGDSIYFDAMTPHAYIAVSEAPPLVLMCNTVESRSVPGFESKNGH
jgi:transcriptional regulator with XRE-family HTH domain